MTELGRKPRRTLADGPHEASPNAMIGRMAPFAARTVREQAEEVAEAAEGERRVIAGE